MAPIPAPPFCPVLDSFVRRIRNYSAAGAELSAMLPIPGHCAAVRLTRAVILLDWRLREYGPECLRRTGDAKLIEHALELEAVCFSQTPTTDAVDAASSVAAGAAVADAVAVAVAVVAVDVDAAVAAGDGVRSQAAYWLAFAARLRTHGYYGWWMGYRTLRLIALRAAAKKDGTPGLRTRAEFDALLAPHVVEMRASVTRAYWRALAGPEVCRAAISAGVAHKFAASLEPIGMERLIAAPGVSLRDLRELEREVAV